MQTLLAKGEIALKALALAAALLLQTACASLEGPDYGVYDKAPEFNQASFELSENLDNNLFEPLAHGYRDLMPDPIETGLLNFFANLRTVNSSINGFLQGKPKSGGTDMMRFLVNSTVGVAGLFDVATPAGFPAQGEDFGQTLAVWGWRNSRYVYVPLVGPSTVRDLPSMAIRAFTPRLLLGGSYDLWMGGVDLVAARADALALTDARDAAALDPYAFTREAYYQRRKFQIFDGDPPLDDFDDFFDETDTVE
ncbi:MAG: VacJ family lipoprotein [Gammaproteobacteria bacterium]|nr:VacJ family lipoprotein [Gammaproteobacteria bacterium]MYF10844.1 VacJ family lipoprotein [Gammaproteobacteria bacterium]MYK29886.1 VacJ family lipoprotein [Gammaproteobacteria bacterium]